MTNLDAALALRSGDASGGESWLWIHQYIKRAGGCPAQFAICDSMLLPTLHALLAMPRRWLESHIRVCVS